MKLLPQITQIKIKFVDHWIGVKFYANKTLQFDSDSSTVDYKPEIDAIHSNSTKCVALDTRSITWKSVDCDTKKSFICERLSSKGMYISI